MKTRNTYLLAAVLFGVLAGSHTAHGQRNFWKSLGNEVLNQTINGNQNRRTYPQPQPQRPQAAGNYGGMSIPNESGRRTSAPYESGASSANNPFGGVLQGLVRQQQQQQTRPRPTPTYTQPRYYQQPQVYQQQPTVYQQQPHVHNHNNHLHHQTQPTPTTIYHRSQPTVTTTPRTVVRAAPSGLPIRITFPRTQGGTCSFTLIGNSSEYPRTLTPGQMQKLEGTTAWQVRYYGNGGNRTYRLTPGQKYVFQRDSQNFLQLYKQPAAVVEEPPVLPQ